MFKYIPDSFLHTILMSIIIDECTARWRQWRSDWQGHSRVPSVQVLRSDSRSNTRGCHTWGGRRVSNWDPCGRLQGRSVCSRWPHAGVQHRRGGVLCETVPKTTSWLESGGREQLPEISRLQTVCIYYNMYLLFVYFFILLFHCDLAEVVRAPAS